MDRLLAGIGVAAAGLNHDGGAAAAVAIMTTDTVPKSVLVKREGFTVGGMAKGAGMLAPALATMLVVLTTDAVADAGELDVALRSATRTTFDRLDSDGAMSTNDTVLLLASGASGVRPDTRGAGRRRDRRVRRTGAGRCSRRRGVDQGHRDRGAARRNARTTRSRSVGRSPATTWSRRPSSAATPTGAGSLPPSVPPAPRSTPTSSTLRSTGPGSAGPAAQAWTGPVSTSPAETSMSSSTCMPATRPRPSGPTTCPTPTCTRTRRTRHDSSGATTIGPIAGRDIGDLAEAGARAEVLADALPWLRRFAGAIVVVKYGGNAMTDDTLKAAFAADMVFLRTVGLRPVVVHGGGPQITPMLRRLGLPGEFKGGFRVTTPETMDVVRMVLVGQVGRELVGLINAHGPLAVGMSRRRRRPVHRDPTGRRWSTAPHRHRPGRRRGGGQPRRGVGPGRRRPDPGDRDRGAGRGRRGAQRECRHRGRGDRGRAGGEQAGRADRRRGSLRRLAGPVVADLHDHRRSARRSAARVSTPAWCPRWRAPARRPRRRGAAHIIDGRRPHAVLLEIVTTAGIGTMVVPANPDGTLKPGADELSGNASRPPPAGPPR